MIINNKLVFTLVAALCFMFICGCEYPQTLAPHFNDKKESIVNSINNKFGFESIDIKGYRTGGGNGRHTLLTIKLVNCKNTPSDDLNMLEATKKIAMLMKLTLNDPKQFECYKVLFVEQKIDGMTITNKYVGHNFQPGEI